MDVLNDIISPSDTPPTTKERYYEMWLWENKTIWVITTLSPSHNHSNMFEKKDIALLVVQVELEKKQLELFCKEM